ncbi:gas vesicle protein [Scopulibacillus daqui]|uniref:Gas vesicle protein n=1 Tax=Scopulibacillus daqui TaxID=1469162 RepID=A0ABS2PXM2_9BACL|nr:sporulation membrane protein YtrI [Scopulibacillus daqui]MBM7644803.1 gas vesicle protein [Scopulibacillus daqui]
MRIPPYYRIPSWQRFLSGVAIGMIIGFLFFVLLFGLAQERQINKIKEQATEIKSLENDKRALLEDQDKENKELEKKLKVQDVQVNILSSQRINLDRIVRYELEQQISERLHSLIKNDIESVAVNKELIYKAVEGHPFTIDKNSYYFKVKSLVIYSVIEINVVPVQPKKKT